MINHSLPAILVFTRTGKEEAQAKVFSRQRSLKRDTAVAESLIKHSLKTARQTGLPVYPVFSNQQEGSNFGERLANALEGVFAKGHEQVIIIGNDCPEISVSILTSAAEEISQNDFVVGPAKDGGLYLLGINQYSYERESFIALSWKQDSLQRHFRVYSEKLGKTVKVLPELSDIDEAKDLTSFIKRSKTAIKYKLLQLLSLALPITISPLYFPKRIFRVVGVPLRAPPYFSFYKSGLHRT